ncbi:IS3 family transposase [Rhodococcus globerulus]|uniref:IS3 family transposase n=1 Tax=Rhodococcus globerulus TaxID=33008 RepID=A0ABU4C5G5_RHOGO|nr:IS3 family transposase [Rhodococcus globerulus]MDV6271433.1 IS3 family transposase [Rhodococcus globerulus]
MAGLQPIAGIPPPESEIETLRTENERLRAEVTYLGKLRALKSQERRAKVRAVEDLKAHYPLPRLLQIADLPRSTFYDRRNRLRRADRHGELKAAIRKTFEDAKGAYWHRRILAVLRRQGRRVSKKTVLTLMRTLGLRCLVRRRKRYNSFRGEVGEAADNVLNRQFAAEAAHTKWVTDVTEFNIGSSKVYFHPSSISMTTGSSLPRPGPRRA